MTRRSKLIALLIFCSVIAIYLPGTGGPLLFDDFPNLGALATADTYLKKLDFVFSGQSGPTGRPISLATFAFQQPYWGADKSILLLTNVAIHAVNGLLVFCLTYLLCSIFSPLRENREFIAVMTCILWVFNPFLVSSSLVLVQRMTLISGFFTFLGLVLYTLARAKYRDGDQRWSMIGSVALFFCTIFSVFSKENGVLTPVLACLIEYFFFSQSSNGCKIKNFVHYFRRALLWYTVFYFSYLLFEFVRSINAVGRDFTPVERFLTQPWILLDYIFNIIIPRSINAIPFNDDYIPVKSVFDFRFIAGGGFWFLTFMGIKRFAPRFVFFGLLFFILAHSLESSVIYLELYFPHRNYVPAFGVAFIVAAVSGVFVKRHPRLIYGALCPYVVLVIYVLWLVINTWSQPRVAAEIWAGHKETSSRAQHFLAAQLLETGELSAAANVLDRLIKMNPDSAVYKAQKIAFCFFDSSEYPALEDDFLHTVSITKPQNGLGPSIDLLAEQIISGQCEKLNASLFDSLVKRIKENRALSEDNFLRASLYGALAKMALAKDEHAQFRLYMLKMFSVTPSQDLALSVVHNYVQLGEINNADVLLQNLRFHAPSNLIRAWVWNSRIDQVELEIAQFVNDKISSN